MFLFHFLIGVRVKSTLLFVGAATVLSILVMVRSTLAYTHCPYANDPSISQTISHRPTLTVMPTSTLTSIAKKAQKAMYGRRLQETLLRPINIPRLARDW